MYNIVAAGAAELGAGVTIVTEYLAAIGDPIVAHVVREEVKRHIREPRHALLLAHLDSEVAGCVEVHPLDQPEHYEIKRLYVRSAFRRRGIAQDLMRAAEIFAQECGGTAIYLDTKSRMREAIALYQTLGYEPVAPYHTTPFADVFMCRHLSEER